MATYLGKPESKLSEEDRTIRTSQTVTDGEWSESLWSLSLQDDSDRSFGDNKEDTNLHTPPISPRRTTSNSSSPQRNYLEPVAVRLRQSRKPIPDVDLSSALGLDCIELRRRDANRVRSWGQQDRFSQHRANTLENTPQLNTTLDASAEGPITKKDKIKRIQSLGRYSQERRDDQNQLSLESLRNKPPRPPPIDLGVPSGRVAEVVNRVEASLTKSEPNQSKSRPRRVCLSRTYSPDRYTYEALVDQRKVEQMVLPPHGNSPPSPRGSLSKGLKHSASAVEENRGRSRRRPYNRGYRQEGAESRRFLTQPIDACWPSEVARKRADAAKSFHEEHRLSPLWVNDNPVYPDPRMNILSAGNKEPLLTRSYSLKQKRNFSPISAMLSSLATTENNKPSDPVPIHSFQNDYDQYSFSSNLCTPSPPKIIDFASSSTLRQLSDDRWSSYPTSVGLFDLLTFSTLSNVSLHKISTFGSNTSDPISEHGLKVIPIRLCLPWTPVTSTVKYRALSDQTKGAFRSIYPKQLSSRQPIVLFVEDVAQGSPFTRGQLLIELDRVSLISQQSLDANAPVFLFANTLIRAYEDEAVSQLCFTVATPDFSKTRLVGGCLEILEDCSIQKCEPYILTMKNVGSKMVMENSIQSLKNFLLASPSSSCSNSNGNVIILN